MPPGGLPPVPRRSPPAPGRAGRRAAARPVRRSAPARAGSGPRRSVRRGHRHPLAPDSARHLAGEAPGSPGRRRGRARGGRHGGGPGPGHRTPRRGGRRRDDGRDGSGGRCEPLGRDRRGRRERAARGAHQDRLVTWTEEAVRDAWAERRRIAAGLETTVLSRTADMVAEAEAGRLDATADRAREALAAMRALLDAVRDEQAEPALRPQPTLQALDLLAHQCRATGRDVEIRLTDRVRTSSHRRRPGRLPRRRDGSGHRRGRTRRRRTGRGRRYVDAHRHRGARHRGHGRRRAAGHSGDRTRRHADHRPPGYRTDPAAPRGRAGHRGGQR
ncbi:hypothetical protein ACR6C2_30510 [Streptomyces sp. INA 01156]